MWGASAINTSPHHNDRVCLFGIITTDPEYRETYRKLTEGVKERFALDDPSLNFPEMFQNLAFAFNNEEVKVTLPEGAYDLPMIEEIDPNEITRIRIIWDSKWAMHIWKTTHKQYKDVLVQWFKGTGGGAGIPNKFEIWDDTKLDTYNIDPDE